MSQANSKSSKQMGLGATETTRLVGVFRGRAKILKIGRPKSAILKSPVLGKVRITFSGIEGDEQADLKLHGGPDKAIHYYPIENYQYWNHLLKKRGFDKSFRSGDFGENLSAAGFREEIVCIGDIFQFGSCVMQITQGRTPCWKLNEHTGVPEMAKLFVETGRTGWYLRVLAEGEAAVGDEIELVERPNPRFSVRDVTWARLARNPKLVESEKISQVPFISTGWAQSFSKIEQTKEINDPSLNWITPDIS